MQKFPSQAQPSSGSSMTNFLRMQMLPPEVRDTINEAVLKAVREIELSVLSGYVLPNRMAQATGLTVKAINGKIDQGVWIEGREWRKGPDGRRYISVKGYEAWVERGRAQT